MRPAPNTYSPLIVMHCGSAGRFRWILPPPTERSSCERMGDEAHACGICIDRPRAVRNLPCGHGGICELCTIELVLQALPSGPNCIYCRCTVSRLMVVPVTKATVGAGPVLRPRRMPTNQAVPEPEGHIFESVEAFLLAMLDSADAEVANAARTALARMPGQGAAAASEDGRGVRGPSRRQETVTGPRAATSLGVNAADSNGLTALMWAAGEGHTDRVTALLAAPGLDVNATDRNGWAALMRAASGGHTDRVTALLAAPGLNVNAAGRYVRTALMLAAYGGHAETVTALLAAPGLDVNSATVTGTTALTEAAYGGHTETVMALLAAPGLDVNAADRNGRTALALAKARRHSRIASLLRAAAGIEENDNTCCIIN